MTRNYEDRREQKQAWVDELLRALQQYESDDERGGSYDKIVEIIRLHGREGVELVSFYLYGQPRPEHFTAGFLADGEAVQDLVARLLSYPEFGLDLNLESWPDPEHYVKVKSSLIPWPGIGQPNPGVILRKG